MLHFWKIKIYIFWKCFVIVCQKCVFDVRNFFFIERSSYVHHNKYLLVIRILITQLFNNVNIPRFFWKCHGCLNICIILKIYYLVMKNVRTFVQFLKSEDEKIIFSCLFFKYVFICMNLFRNIKNTHRYIMNIINRFGEHALDLTFSKITIKNY